MKEETLERINEFLEENYSDELRVHLLQLKIYRNKLSSSDAVVFGDTDDAISKYRAALDGLRTYLNCNLIGENHATHIEKLKRTVISSIIDASVGEALKEKVIKCLDDLIEEVVRESRAKAKAVIEDVLKDFDVKDDVIENLVDMIVEMRMLFKKLDKI